MNKLIINYYDALLYNTDIQLFTNKQWLNDNSIHFYFKYIFNIYYLYI